MRLFFSVPDQLSLTVYRCRVLHSLLLQNNDEFDDPDPEAVRRLVADSRLQVGLLACAAELVQYASSGQPSFPALTQRMDVLGCVLDMWEGLQHTQRVLLQARPSAVVTMQP